MQQKIIKTQAIVLNSIRWKESSKIVTLYCQELGKIKVIARGVLRAKSAFAGKIESLNLLEVIVVNKGSRSIQDLREAELIKSFNPIRLDLKKFPYAMAIIEIINQIIEEEQADSQFFDFLIEMFNSIAEAEIPENTFLYFLLKIASYLGFKPSLEKCHSGDTNLCQEKVFLSQDSGEIFCNKCNVNQTNPIPLLKEQFFYLKNLQNQHHRRLNSWRYTCQGATSLIQVLVNYINYHMDQNLRINSLQLLK